MDKNQKIYCNVGSCEYNNEENENDDDNNHN